MIFSQNTNQALIRSSGSYLRMRCTSATPRAGPRLFQRGANLIPRRAGVDVGAWGQDLGEGH